MHRRAGMVTISRIARALSHIEPTSPRQRWQRPVPTSAPGCTGVGRALRALVGDSGGRATARLLDVADTFFMYSDAAGISMCLQVQISNMNVCMVASIRLRC